MGQLIEYNMRKFFLKISRTKWGRETSPRPFSKKNEIEYISGSLI